MSIIITTCGDPDCDFCNRPKPDPDRVTPDDRDRALKEAIRDAVANERNAIVAMVHALAITMLPTRAAIFSDLDNLATQIQMRELP